MPFGSTVLLIGAGPTGLILAQLLKVSSVSDLLVKENSKKFD